MTGLAGRHSHSTEEVRRNACHGLNAGTADEAPWSGAAPADALPRSRREILHQLRYVVILAAELTESLSHGAIGWSST